MNILEMNEVTRKEVREEGGYRDDHASENLDRCKERTWAEFFYGQIIPFCGGLFFIVNIN